MTEKLLFNVHKRSKEIETILDKVILIGLEQLFGPLEYVFYHCRFLHLTIINHRLLLLLLLNYYTHNFTMMLLVKIETYAQICNQKSD